MKIACIGNAVYDIVARSDRFLVEGLKHSFNDVSFIAGGPASCAASVLAKYGNHVDFYGQIGNDASGKYVYNVMLKEGINLKYLSCLDNFMTPQSFILVNKSNGSRTICSMRDPIEFENPKIRNFRYETDYDFILTDGKYADESIELINKNPHAISIIDAGRVNSRVLKVCKEVDYIICSEEFANNLTKKALNNDGPTIGQILRELENYFPNAKGIAITVGERGYICKKDGILETYPAYDSGLKAIDTNGAGDIFHGAFTHAMANGYDYYSSLEFANVIASLSTTKVGGRDSIPSLEEIESKIKKQEKILTLIKPKKRDE